MGANNTHLFQHISYLLKPGIHYVNARFLLFKCKLGKPMLFKYICFDFIRIALSLVCLSSGMARNGVERKAVDAVFLTRRFNGFEKGPAKVRTPGEEQAMIIIKESLQDTATVYVKHRPFSHYAVKQDLVQ